MEISTRAISSKMNDMVKVFISMLMVTHTKGSSLMIRLTVWESSILTMEADMKANLLPEKYAGMEHIIIKMMMDLLQ